MNAPLSIIHPAHPVAIGSPFEDGTYGGAIAVRDAILGVVWPDKALAELVDVAWHAQRKPVPGATSCCDSEANTRAMAEAGSVLAELVLARGFVLPARDVLELGYRYFKPTTRKTYDGFRDGDNPSSLPPGYPYASSGSVLQTEFADFRAGGPQAFEEAWYWSSTQYSEGDAWSQYFDNGGQYNDGKSFQARARAVRLIQLNV